MSAQLALWVWWGPVHKQLWLRMSKSALGRYCCKTLFALLIKNSPGYRRDFLVKMWVTSSPDDKRVSNLAKAAEATKIGARRLDRLMAGKLSPRNFGLLQQYLHTCDFVSRSPDDCSLRRSRPNARALITAVVDSTATLADQDFRSAKALFRSFANA